VSDQDAGPPEFPAVLAIDGGNSKTEAALVAADGTLLASVRGAGVPGVLTLEESVEVLASVARLAAGQAGLDPAGARIAQHLSACVANNTDLPEEEEVMAAALRAAGLTGTVELANDTFAVLRAGLDGAGPHWGVGVTCGAGINCVGVAPDGRTARFLSLGQLSGDWGGGYGLGRDSIWWAIRAEDGRGPQTALREAVAAYFGRPTMWDVAVAFHQGELAWDAPRGLVPVLFETAQGGDEVAANLVRRMAQEVTVMALAAIRRLGLAEEPVPVVLGGGVLAARDPLLTGEVTRRLAAEAPRALPRIVDVPPVAGAALLGLDHIGAPVSAQDRLSACYPPPAALQ
jgi:N-acetylglucosamine kinase-like BadF-type ATPase